MSARPPRSGCPIASSLDLLGDRWTLVILRDLLTGKSRYAELLASPERISTNILAARLADMEAAGLIVRSAYQESPRRFAYAVTAKGEALLPVLQQLCLWGNAHLPDTWTPPTSFMKRAAPQ